MYVAVECVEAEPSGAMRSRYMKGKGWQSGHVRLIPGRGASECPRWPESIGEQERPLTCHMPPSPLPHTPAHSWSLYCFCRMSPWLRQDAVNGQPPADNSQLHSLNIAFYFTHHALSTLLCCV